MTLSLKASALLLFTLLAPALQGANPDQERAVLSAYLAYYGRPADVVGLGFWAGRLSEAGGDLAAIMQPFGTSAEFEERFGALPREALVANLYQQLFGRPPDPGGLTFYTGELLAGRMTLQTVALQILYGARGADIDIVDNRLAVAEAIIDRARATAVGDAFIDYLALGDLQQSVGAEPASLSVALDAVADEFAVLASFSRRFLVTELTDSYDGRCDARCSIRDAVGAANAAPGRDLIVLPAGEFLLERDGPDDDELAYRDLEVLDDLVLRGRGADATRIDAQGRFRLVFVDPFRSGVTASLEQLTLSGGNQTFGGAVFNDGMLTLDEVVIRDSRAANGGGLLSRGDVSINDSQFLDNRAESGGNVDRGFGGALWMEAGTSLLLARSNLGGNHADFNGGALYSPGEVTADGGSFESNSAGAKGGAADLLGPATFNGTHFTANEANDGGALSAQGGASLTLAGLTFDSNHATGVDLGGGGALYTFDADATISDCLFENNDALGEGGGAIEAHFRQLDITATRFIGNRAIRTDNSQLPSNTDSGFGGALLVIADTVVNVADSSFDGNSAGTTGGAAYVDQRTAVRFTTTVISRNRAESKFGGGIFSEGDVTLDRSDVVENYARLHGGGLTMQVGDSQVLDSVILRNEAANGGGVGHFNDGTLEIRGTRIAENRATVEAGGGLLADVGVVRIIDSEVMQNTAARFGGGISQNSARGTLFLAGVTVTDNTAPAESAVTNFGRLVIENSEISGGCRNHAVVEDRGGNELCAGL